MLFNYYTTVVQMLFLSNKIIRVSRQVYSTVQVYTKTHSKLFCSRLPLGTIELINQ